MKYIDRNSPIRHTSINARNVLILFDIGLLYIIYYIKTWVGSESTSQVTNSLNEMVTAASLSSVSKSSSKANSSTVQNAHIDLTAIGCDIHGIHIGQKSISQMDFTSSATNDADMQAQMAGQIKAQMQQQAAKAADNPASKVVGEIMGHDSSSTSVVNMTNIVKSSMKVAASVTNDQSAKLDTAQKASIHFVCVNSKMYDIDINQYSKASLTFASDVANKFIGKAEVKAAIDAQVKQSQKDQGWMGGIIDAVGPIVAYVIVGLVVVAALALVAGGVCMAVPKCRQGVQDMMKGGRNRRPLRIKGLAGGYHPYYGW